MARDDNKIAALKRERAAYLAAGDEVRARQVDVQLGHYGHAPEPEEGPTGEDGAPKGRTTRAGRQRTAEEPKGGAQSAGRGSARKGE